MAVMPIHLRSGMLLSIMLLSLLPTLTKAHLRCVGCMSKCCCNGKCCRCRHLIYEMWWFWLLWCLVVLLSCCCAYIKRRHRRFANQNNRLRTITTTGGNLAQTRIGNGTQNSTVTVSLEKLPSYNDAIKSSNRDLPEPPPPAYVDMPNLTHDNFNQSGLEHFTEIPLRVSTNQDNDTGNSKRDNLDSETLTISSIQPSSSKGSDAA
ncbi:uncharacterized protein TRIADDRAFT_58625 [Trichoplax adhaerens]|uniref:Vesicular, overexpressed in cancer, prosurvival protein 1 n=1 Tax=Trichoplax adhaerens TaxID=10228 RepID=B3S378_TRIAD|nr:predicted protein [Trichoplax adhaerens]EDV22922.1 predicted protein [Trichoplax adhaerens]|eukprot:XP_002114788.1 predicted protein [Trichoplax adhaerens]